MRFAVALGIISDNHPIEKQSEHGTPAAVQTKFDTGPFKSMWEFSILPAHSLYFTPRVRRVWKQERDTPQT